MIGIYKITNKLNNKVYIGQSNNIQRRFEEHKYQEKNSAIHNAIKKYGLENFNFEIIEECSLEELDEKEIFWIKYYNSFEDGYNLTLGGQARCFYDIDKIYQEYLLTENMAITAKKVGCHISTIRQILRKFDINKTECQLEKPVEQIDPKTLQVIKIYDSIADASRVLGITKDAISMAANGIHNSCQGYFWRFVGEKKDFIKIKKQKQKVYQLDKNTEKIINTFESMADAAESLGKDRKNGGSRICAVCKGRKPTAYGYKWKYVYD